MSEKEFWRLVNEYRGYGTHQAYEMCKSMMGQCPTLDYDKAIRRIARIVGV